MAFGLKILKENTDYFGLDIGVSAIKVVQLKKGLGGKYELVSFGSAPVPEGVSQSDSEMDKKKIVDILTGLLHSMHLITKNTVVSLAGNSVFTTVVKFPQMPISEIRKAVNYQAEQNIPLKLSEVKLDWQLVGESRDKKEMFIMIIAAPLTKTQKIVDIVERAGLELYAVETNAVAAARALQTSEPLYMVVDIGTFSSELTVIRNGIVTHTRAVPVGGKVMTRAIAQGLGMEMAQAEQFKVKFGVEEDKMEGKIYKAAKPILENLAEEIDRSIKYYFNQFGENIQLIKLTGGSSRTLGLQKFLSDALSVNMVYGNPWETVAHKSEITNQLSQNAAEFTVAVGLAMRGI